MSGSGVDLCAKYFGTPRLRIEQIEQIELTNRSWRSDQRKRGVCLSVLFVSSICSICSIRGLGVPKYFAKIAIKLFYDMNVIGQSLIVSILEG